ncbi:hypothetical protein [Hyalangium versicolor]|uniref:hypothetical protein n=1 Tax=Hyalangium versicolor TaxID=2861190 RepID=UPI001CCB58D6|nr:hypothetical protein [Hyalangium versicolor]
MKTRPFRSNSLPSLSTPRPTAPTPPRSAPPSPRTPTAPQLPDITRQIPTQSVRNPQPGKLQGNYSNLESHFGRKTQEQAALNQWNTNAAGRNQGVVHLIDYAYARPTKFDTTPPNVKLTPQQQQALKQGDKLGWNEAQWKQNLGETNFNSLKSKGYFSEFAGGDNKVPVGANPQRWQQLTTNHQQLSSQISTGEAALKTQRQAYTQQLTAQGVPKKEMGAKIKEWEAQNPQKQQLDALKAQRTGIESDMNAQRRYTLASDTSKQGRLEQIEKANGLPPGSLRNGNEIVGGTNAVQQHLQNNAPFPANALSPNKPLEMYVKQPDGKWSLQQVQPQDLATTYSGKQEAGGLSIAQWGLSPEELKLSTVMGAGGKK